MFRKASKLFSSTNTVKKLSPVDATSATPKVSSVKTPSKKRTIGIPLLRTPSSSSGRINSSSLSTSSIETSGYASAPPSKAKDLRAKRSQARLRPKRSLPKWEIKQEEFTSDMGFFVPYMQGYSPMSIENDFQTSELLKRLYPSPCPIFQQFPTGQVPHNILDLGCGLRGIWVIEAATYWRAHGTKVTGFDLMDPDPCRIDSSIRNNVRFVRGNFLMKLPFEDNSFDLVRMANLNLCIPQARWQDVLQEAHRVLRPSGMLEVIDDEMLWPYLESLPTSPVGLTSSRPSALQGDSDDEDEDLRLPDAYSPYDRNVSTSQALEGLFEKMIWFNHGIHSRPHEFMQDYITKVFGERATHEAGACQPRVVKVALPPAGFELDEKEIKGDKSGFGSLFTIEWEKPRKGDDRSTENPTIFEPASLPETITSKAARRLLGSTDPTRLGEKRDITGLVLSPERSDFEDVQRYPDKFAMMDSAQVETFICKNMHVLLSCRKALTEYICELQGEEGNQDKMTGEDKMVDKDKMTDEISSAFWDYECFRRTRFNLPHTLSELKMEESSETSDFRLSTDSTDSGYSSSSTQSRGESHSKHYPTVNINLEELKGLTCVRVIHIFNGTKSKGAS